MKQTDAFFDVSRRVMLSAFAALLALPMLLSTSALAQLPASPAGQTPATDPLPSWNDTDPKKAIKAFVERVTKQGSPDYVPEADRIATFDNDGTLWVEQPMYVQLAFALDRVKALAPQHPEWKETQPFKAVLEGDMNALAETGEHGLIELLMVPPDPHVSRRLHRNCPPRPAPRRAGWTVSLGAP